MSLLYDTNIILSIVRATDLSGIINFLNPDDDPVYISIVSEGEIKSLALQNNWGINRRNILDNLLDQIYIIDVTKLNIDTYTDIDSYSQLKNPGFVDYPFLTPRNMGKNDLWIASLSALLGLQLVTIDSDFDHLNNVFLELRKINPADLLTFFKK